MKLGKLLKFLEPSLTIEIYDDREGHDDYLYHGPVVSVPWIFMDRKLSNDFHDEYAINVNHNLNKNISTRVIVKTDD